MNDIYIFKGCQTTPSSDVLPRYDGELNIDHLDVMATHSKYLNVNISLDEARILLDILKQHGAQGMIIPVEYKLSKIDVHAAKEIAECEIHNKIAKYYPGHLFDPIYLLDEEPLWWKFRAPPQKLKIGGLYIFVDKLDGHIWGYEELEKLAYERM